MFESSTLRYFFLVVASMVLGTSVSNARPAYIEDNGAFFSEPAKSEAARNIGELERTVKKDLAIETFKEIPEDVKQGVNIEDKAAMNRLFEEWAVKQARSKGVNGVYILLVKSPAHLQVVVGNDTQKRAFTLHDRDTLVSTMLAKLRAKKYDDALLDGVDFVSSTMRAHAAAGVRTGFMQPNEVRRTNHGSSGWIFTILIGLLVVWVVVAIFRAISRGGGVGGGMPMSPMSGGGGFFSSLLGGMFGAAAGMWMYDQFFGERGSSALGAERDNLDSRDPGFSGQDTDYSGSGDGFGDTSGGGDSGGDFGGGGDAGGGDAGGGDF